MELNRKVKLPLINIFICPRWDPMLPDWPPTISMMGPFLNTLMRPPPQMRGILYLAGRKIQSRPCLASCKSSYPSSVNLTGRSILPIHYNQLRDKNEFIYNHYFNKRKTFKLWKEPQPKGLKIYKNNSYILHQSYL